MRHSAILRRGRRRPLYPRSIGSLITNTAPPASSESAVSVPLCISTTRRAVASPNPLPRCLVVTNGSNRQRRISGSMPGPWSRTRISQPVAMTPRNTPATPPNHLPPSCLILVPLWSPHSSAQSPSSVRRSNRRRSRLTGRDSGARRILARRSFRSCSSARNPISPCLPGCTI